MKLREFIQGGWKAAVSALGRKNARFADLLATSRDATFRLMYQRFREILAFNDTTLGLIADIEDRLSQRKPFSFEALEPRVRQTAMDVFVMVKNLNQLAGERHAGLYGVLRNLNEQLEIEMSAGGLQVVGPAVLPLAALRSADAPLAGTKMATLGEVANGCRLRAPTGFAITTATTSHLLSQGGLWERCERLGTFLEQEDPMALAEACGQVWEAIMATALPAELESAIREAFAEHFPDPMARVAVPSSAVGEDSAISSHAGLYTTELDVDAAQLIHAYKNVVASAFSPTAIAYRYERGLSVRESLMAVGCVEMVNPRCAGILFTRPPDDPEADAVLISLTRGLAADLAAGQANAEVLMVIPGREDRVSSRLLSPAESAGLVRAARSLEAHFGSPQDVEWAIDQHGRLVILQSRPIVAFVAREEKDAGVMGGRPPLTGGGFTACPGIGSGPVVLIRDDRDLPTFPEGGVLVARHSSPTFARVMRRCAAIITDVGSPIGHMASLAREFDVPAIVGLDEASRSLTPGQVVTVDAGACRVYDGVLPAPFRRERSRASPADSPALAKLQRLGRLITPLSLTDPTGPEFTPEGCRSLHDITRFVHEKAYEVMFHYGDLASEDRHYSWRLEAHLPIVIRVFDVGGGIAEGNAGSDRVELSQVSSAPLQALLEGMLEPRIRWDLPRPVSVRGFLSVLGESMAGLPAEARQVGRLSYAIASDRYLNFSTKAGYHFQTIDTYCGQSQNKNYIHFRFHGGAADVERRQRRIRCLSTVLAALDFRIHTRGDLLTARLDKYPRDDIRARLVDLGRLTLCARQLDMLMDTDASTEQFAQAFLKGEWERF